VSIETLQIFLQLLGAGIALRRILGQQLLHDGIQLLRHRRIDRAHRRRILPQQRGKDFRRRIAGKGRLPVAIS
jgi:hypothetical protein